MRPAAMIGDALHDLGALKIGLALETFACNNSGRGGNIIAHHFEIGGHHHRFGAGDKVFAADRLQVLGSYVVRRLSAASSG